MRPFLWAAIACAFLVTSCRCESSSQNPGPAPVTTVATGVTIDGCSVELRQRCSASGCSCLNGRCSGEKCGVFNDGCSGAQRNACSSFACGCLNEHCSGGYCVALSDGCSDEFAKKCAGFGCGCANQQCSGGACPTLPDGCSERHRSSCALSGCSCTNNQCSGGACPTIADGCEEYARRDCAGLGCSCWSGKCWGEACPGDVSAPTQPDTGPGSSKYPHAGYRTTETGKTNADSLLYEPTGPVAEKAPLVVMFHGLWPDARPGLYQPLVVHLARKGYTVILPLYGSTNGIHKPDIETYAKDARLAITRALTKLGGDKPDSGINQGDPTRQIAFVGHAVGAMVALRLAQPNLPKLPDAEPIPPPKAIVLHDPTGTDGANTAQGSNPAGLSKIPLAIKLLIIASESSLKEGFAGASLIGEAWQQTATKTKNLWVVRSDRRCSPTNPAQCVDLERSTPSTDRNWSLVGTTTKVEGFAEGKYALDAIDWRGYWRVTEAALRTAFEQNPIGFDPFCRTKTDAKCNDSGRRDMGEWTLGTSKVPLPTLLDADDAAVSAALEAAAGAKSKAPPAAPH